MWNFSLEMQQPEKGSQAQIQLSQLSIGIEIFFIQSLTGSQNRIIYSCCWHRFNHWNLPSFNQLEIKKCLSNSGPMALN